MRICVVEVVSLEEGSDQFCITFQKLVQHLTIVNMVATLWSHRRWCIMQQLILLDWLYVHLLVKCLVRSWINIGWEVWNPLVHLFSILLVEVLLGSTLSVIACWNEERYVKFDISESVKYFKELLCADLFVHCLLGRLENAFLIAHGWSAWPSCVVRIDAYPLSLVLRLNHL